MPTQFENRRSGQNGTGVSVVRGKSNSMQSGESDAKQFVTMEGRSMFQENRAGRAAINSPSPRDPWKPRHEPTVSSRPWRIVSLIFLLAVQRGEKKHTHTHTHTHTSARGKTRTRRENTKLISSSKVLFFFISRGYRGNVDDPLAKNSEF